MPVWPWPVTMGLQLLCAGSAMQISQRMPCRSLPILPCTFPWAGSPKCLLNPRRSLHACGHTCTLTSIHVHTCTSANSLEQHNFKCCWSQSQPMSGEAPALTSFSALPQGKSPSDWLDAVTTCPPPGEEQLVRAAAGDGPRSPPGARGVWTLRRVGCRQSLFQNGVISYSQWV
ncbi:hypothetical protein KIL84_022057 [Mauremys mutica]|uniref:Uncharacterized protein n=1 Tax=Mauremys mutica TaxID=74926 RepID=A0A9D4B3S6_9SAUR|nr:hypothetical protein KIL84_022057 [Mauremys mutica]